jgi:hypothetical protein
MNFGGNNHPLKELLPSVQRAIIYRSFLMPNNILSWYRFNHYEQRYLLEDAGLIKSLRNNVYSPWHHCVYSDISYCLVCKRVGKNEIGTSKPLQKGCLHCMDSTYDFWQAERFHEWRDVYQIECINFIKRQNKLCAP